MSEYEQNIPQLQITDQPVTLEIRRSRGAGGPDPHLENHKKVQFFSNNEPDPLESYQASIQC